MFDVSLSEVMVIAIVALIVIGPERLPKVARTLGHLLGRMQRYVGVVKADISRELQLDELKKLQAEMQESAHILANSISSEIQTVEQQLGDTAQSITSVIQGASVSDVQTAQAAGTSSAVTVDGFSSGAIVAANHHG